MDANANLFSVYRNERSSTRSEHESSPETRAKVAATSETYAVPLSLDTVPQFVLGAAIPGMENRGSPALELARHLRRRLTDNVTHLHELVEARENRIAAFEATPKPDASRAAQELYRSTNAQRR